MERGDILRFSSSDVVVNVTVIDTGGLKGWDQSVPFTIEAPPTTTPILTVETNYKPVVAMVFMILLLIAGMWSSERKPWKNGREKMAVTKAFIISSMPFILAEAVTGIVSGITGELRIPPSVGIGTALDSAILLMGLIAAVLRTLWEKPSKAAVTDEPKNR